MNILFLLAALAHSSGADSNCVLGNIPFGSAESHIEPSGIRLNKDSMGIDDLIRYSHLFVSFWVFRFIHME